jgi:hypothetical protein
VYVGEQITNIVLYSHQPRAKLREVPLSSRSGAAQMDEGRKRVIGIMAAILASLHMQTADDLFGTPEGSPRTDKLIDASIQWAERIMRKIDCDVERYKSQP